MIRTIAFSNIKGGSGKTTTAVNVSAALAQKGHRVLLVDTDPQGHASLSLGIKSRTPGRDLFTLLIDKADAQTVIHATSNPNLKLLPSSKNLISFEKNYGRSREARMYLEQRLRTLHDRFDYITFDTPPTLSLLTFSSLIAAREVAIPVQAHFLGMKGVFDMVRLLYRIDQIYKTNIKLIGIIPTFFNEKIRLSKAVVSEIKKNLGENIFFHPIRNNISLAEAPMFGKTIFEYNSKASGAIDYSAVAVELERMEEQDYPRVQTQ
jgi:chromosome partitioning protein